MNAVFKTVVTALLDAVLFIVSLIDFIPELFLSEREKQNRKKRLAKMSKITDPNDPRSAWRSAESPDLLKLQDQNANLYQRFEQSCKLFAGVNTLGVREILAIEEENQPNGKVFKKFDLGNYKWQTYEEVQNKTINFSNGLLNMGVKSHTKLVLFCESRPEWLVSALSCFRINVPVVTLYSTLGIDALKYGINETEATHIITSGDQLVKIEKILTQIPKVTHLIVITNPHCANEVNRFKANNRGISVLLMNEVEELGEGTKVEFIPPKAQDLAVIMYTSGSTGNPKGVMMSHLNILTSIESFSTRVDFRAGKDIYIAYLPLAHILELVLELCTMFNGVRLGYSSAQTMVDSSTAIKNGQKGDIRILKPTIMATVPLILERLCKTVNDKISKRSWFTQALFKKLYAYKLDACRAGRKSFLLDRILFKRLNRAVLGGKVKYMVCGSALLSKEVQEFVQVCLSGVKQGYGLTETCAGGTTQMPYETNTMEVGSVISACEIRLVDWDEPGYRCTDKPNPRGEIHIGGDTVAMGYYNLPEKTKEDFYYHNGVRYFATGDIGEMLPNGNIKIIDRKKDLIKLHGGEYVSLNNVETCLKLMPIIDNCCTYAKPFETYVIGLICANQRKIIEYAESLGLSEVTDFKSAIKNEKLISAFLKDIEKHCLKHKMARFEIPSKIKFVEEIWLPDTGLVTDSMKLKRKQIEQFYSNDIEALYAKQK